MEGFTKDLLEKAKEAKQAKEVEEEIKDYFKECLGIQLEDSPQVLEEYLYLEFEDLSYGSEVKFRLQYLYDRKHFLSMGKGDRMLFILSAFVNWRFGKK